MCSVFRIFLLIWLTTYSAYAAVYVGGSPSDYEASRSLMMDALNKTRDACIGLSDHLDKIKSLAGIDTAVSAAGVALGSVAVAKGVKQTKTLDDQKNLIDELNDLEKNLSTYESAYSVAKSDLENSQEYKDFLPIEAEYNKLKAEIAEQPLDGNDAVMELQSGSDQVEQAVAATAEDDQKLRNAQQEFKRAQEAFNNAKSTYAVAQKQYVKSDVYKTYLEKKQQDDAEYKSDLAKAKAAEEKYEDLLSKQKQTPEYKAVKNLEKKCDNKEKALKKSSVYMAYEGAANKYDEYTRLPDPDMVNMGELIEGPTPMQKELLRYSNIMVDAWDMVLDSREYKDHEQCLRELDSARDVLDALELTDDVNVAIQNWYALKDQADSSKIINKQKDKERLAELVKTDEYKVFVQANTVYLKADATFKKAKATFKKAQKAYQKTGEELDTKVNNAEKVEKTPENTERTDKFVSVETRYKDAKEALENTGLQDAYKTADAAYEDAKQEYQTKKSGLERNISNLGSQADEHGKVRTGVLAANAATNVVGAVVSGVSVGRSKGDLQDMVDDCIGAVRELGNEYNQAKVSKTLDDEQAQRVNNVIRACGDWSIVNLKSIGKRAGASLVSNVVGATTGVVGTVVSATSVHQQDINKAQKMGGAANAMSGVATAASAVATVFSASQISAIKRAAGVADACRATLDEVFDLYLSNSGDDTIQKIP